MRERLVFRPVPPELVNGRTDLLAGTDGHLYVRRGEGRPHRFAEFEHEGYQYVRRLRVHRLVCAAFHGWDERMAGLDVAHWNHDSQDNRPANLHWASRRKNVRESVEAGRHPHGSTHGRAKINEQEALEIRRLFAEGWSMSGLAERFGICRQSVAPIVQGKTWRRATGTDARPVDLRVKKMYVSGRGWE